MFHSETTLIHKAGVLGFYFQLFSAKGWVGLLQNCRTGFLPLPENLWDPLWSFTPKENFWGSSLFYLFYNAFSATSNCSAVRLSSSLSCKEWLGTEISASRKLIFFTGIGKIRATHQSLGNNCKASSVWGKHAADDFQRWCIQIFVSLFFYNGRIIESFRSERTFKMIESNCKPTTAKSSTKTCP